MSVGVNTKVLSNIPGSCSNKTLLMTSSDTIYKEPDEGQVRLSFLVLMKKTGLNVCRCPAILISLHFAPTTVAGTGN